MVLNNVVPSSNIKEDEFASVLAGTKIPSLPEFMNGANFHHEVETQGENGVRKIPFADSELLAGCLGVEPAVVIASPALLALGARRTAQLHSAKPSGEWLETWLENFPWKSCYDDRTLVVAYGGVDDECN